MAGTTFPEIQLESTAAIQKARAELAEKEARMGVPSLAQLMHEVETAVAAKHDPQS